jgi:teichuronic acid biosynthesis glycosyltransferase TuaC
VKKHLLFISTIFPSTLDSQIATFTYQEIYALKEYFDIDVINPVPWHQKITNHIPYANSLNGISIYHPTYWYTPKIFRNCYGLFYYSSIKSCATKLIKNRGYDVVYSFWLYPDGWASLKIADSFRIPTFVKAIGTDANRLVKESIIAGHTLDVIAHSNKTLSVSEALKGKLVSIGANPSNIVVMYSGVDRDIFHRKDKAIVRNELGFALEDTLILFCGNFIKTKGLDELADAVAFLSGNNRFTNIKLLMAGSGTYEPEFRKRLKADGILDLTFFMGRCTLPIVANLMNAADVVCLPSYSEGLPNVVLEALCCNAKVVATKVGGILELEGKHRNLYLTPPRDALKLAEALKTALSSECFEDCSDDIYSWKEYARRIVDLFGV